MPVRSNENKAQLESQQSHSQAWVLSVRALGRLLPRCIRPDKEQEAQEIMASSTFGTSEQDAQRRNRSTDSLAVGKTLTCKLLNKLPLEFRLEIYACVLGRDIFRLVTVPWKVTTAPDADGSLSMTQDHFNPGPRPQKLSSGISLLITCHQIYQEAIDLLYSTNTFVFYDFPTIHTFGRHGATSKIGKD